MRSGNRRKALYSCYHHIVGTTGTMDHQQVAVRVPASDNADMGIIRVENQISRLRFIPGNLRTINMLHKIGRAHV